MTVGLVIVSHSASLAAGVVELAGQMAPGVTLVAAGGADGGLGTDFDTVSGALEQADSGDGVVVLYDLGSAVMTTETVLEFLDPDAAARVMVVDAPLVEGAVAAAVAAQGGEDLAAVARAAVSAAQLWEVISTRSTDDGVSTSSTNDASSTNEGVSTSAVEDAPREWLTATAALINPLGLHARPAAQLAAAAAEFSAEVKVGRSQQDWVGARSVLAVVGLALRGGETVMVGARGSDAETAVATLANLIESGFGEADDPSRPHDGHTEPSTHGSTADTGRLGGSPGAPGLAVGRAHHLRAAEPDLVATEPESIEAETSRLDAGIAAAAAKLQAGSEFERAQAAIVTDPVLRQLALAELRLGAEKAWWQAIVQQRDLLAGHGDELVAARAIDVVEAGLAVLAEWGVAVRRVPEDLAGQIVIAAELGPSEVPDLVDAGVAGVVLTGGSTTAHAVIVARGLGLPMVIRVGPGASVITDATVLILDGDTGVVRVDPSEAESRAASEEVARQRESSEALRKTAHQPVILASGREIKVYANIGSEADARAAVESGADGVGLLRTELLILDRPELPNEATQTADLQAIFEVLGEREIVVRVLDAGGDKPVRALTLDPITNGFLGVRGLRWLLANPQVLHTQLRAICRAAVGHRVQVMAPMVTVAAEVVAFRVAVEVAMQSVRADGLPCGELTGIGVMIEVPAAALAADEICAVADFVSIGSNDLTSYTNAADRTLGEVADLLDPGSTAVHRLIETICRYAAATGTPVAVCGEMAGVPEYASELVRLGVAELSMAASRIPVIKAHLIAESAGG